jgi:hypothetical protein
MGLHYNNADPPHYSEAHRTWDVPQDWRADDIDTLTLYIHGRTANHADSLYVALEDTEGRTTVSIHSDPNIMLSDKWMQWNISLGDFTGVNLAAVTRMYLGVGHRAHPVKAGAGLIYIDDIRLTKRAP